MSVIRKSGDLQVVVLRIFEDFCRFGGGIYLISPWIRNFSFTEAVIDGLQIMDFGPNPSIFTVFKRCSERQPDQKFRIVSHTFGIREDASINDFWKLMHMYDIDPQNHYTRLFEKTNFEVMFDLYQILFNRFRKYSKFNNPWISIRFKDYKEFLDFLGNSKNYREAIHNLVRCFEQSTVNLEYLRDLEKFQENPAMRLSLHNNFHAKIFIAGSSAITGSSNWTFSGFTRNDEINLFFSEIDSPEEFEKIREKCIEIEKQSEPVTVDNIKLSISIHKFLESIYGGIFNWLTDNKRQIVKNS